MSLSALLVNTAVPPPLRAAFTWPRVRPAENGDEELWRSVVARAVLDAIGQVSPLGGGTTDRCIRAARRWFRWSDRWYVTACHLGNIDGKLVRALVLAEVKRLDYEDRALYALFVTCPFLGEPKHDDE